MSSFGAPQDTSKSHSGKSAGSSGVVSDLDTSTSLGWTVGCSRDYTPIGARIMARLPTLLLQHFRAPLHCRPVTGADGVGSGANAACGDAIEAGVWCSDGLVREVAWSGRGCGAAIACASLAAERLYGRALAEARAFDLAAAVEDLGGLGPHQRHAVQLVARAFAAALSNAADSCQS
ncbi:MAG: iron-sulfur cluster assembly scaffold protein [Planctomycetes bacterium]|nr:iron-sulfur cluster assembly scaffold protein [Planctomycetota bacterium]